MRFPLEPLKINKLPQPPSLRKLLGPSFILLGLGLGSGEVILWPYLTSRYGMGIIWGAVIGLTLQWVMNLEIERYALVNGESVFVGWARKWRGLPVWFLLSTFIPWMWPGIIASSASLWGGLVGVKETGFLAMVMLTVAGLILTLGPILYKTVERLQKTLIMVSVPFLLVLVLLLVKAQDWVHLFKGVVGVGDGYWGLPKGIPIATFLAALAYSGAGGNLNLAQAFYIKEKGYGMGKYAGRITSILTGKAEKVSVTGSTFAVNDENVGLFRRWWRAVSAEHLIVFLGTGLVSILLLAFLAHLMLAGRGGDTAGIEFVFSEAAVVGQRLGGGARVLMLVILGATLFATQLTVLDATSRILTENLILLVNRFEQQHISRIYYSVLWVQIAAGVAIFASGFTQPLQLLIVSAVLNAWAMFIHVGLTLWLNLTSISKPFRPVAWRVVGMIMAMCFYGGFSVYTLWSLGK